jgi:hypothetical protein
MKYNIFILLIIILLLISVVLFIVFISKDYSNYYGGTKRWGGEGDDILKLGTIENISQFVNDMEIDDDGNYTFDSNITDEEFSILNEKLAKFAIKTPKMRSYPIEEFRNKFKTFLIRDFNTALTSKEKQESISQDFSEGLYMTNAKSFKLSDREQKRPLIGKKDDNTISYSNSSSEARAKEAAYLISSNKIQTHSDINEEDIDSINLADKAAKEINDSRAQYNETDRKINEYGDSSIQKPSFSKSINTRQMGLQHNQLTILKQEIKDLKELIFNLHKNTKEISDLEGEISDLEVFYSEETDEDLIKNMVDLLIAKFTILLELLNKQYTKISTIDTITEQYNNLLKEFKNKDLDKSKLDKDIIMLKEELQNINESYENAVQNINDLDDEIRGLEDKFLFDLQQIGYTTVSQKNINDLYQLIKQHNALKISESDAIITKLKDAEKKTKNKIRKINRLF